MNKKYMKLEDGGVDVRFAGEVVGKATISDDLSTMKVHILGHKRGEIASMLRDGIGISVRRPRLEGKNPMIMPGLDVFEVNIIPKK
jgi:hypothetical protein